MSYNLYLVYSYFINLKVSIIYVYHPLCYLYSSNVSHIVYSQCHSYIILRNGIGFSFGVAMEGFTYHVLYLHSDLPQVSGTDDITTLPY